MKSHGLKFISDVKDRKNRDKNDGNENLQTEQPESQEEARPSRNASFTNLPAVTISSPVTPYIYPTSAAGPGSEPMVILSPRIATPSPGHVTPNLLPNANIEAGNGDELDDEFNLPVSLALFILFLYMFSGAWVFTVTDNWSFVDAIYFVFISTSTVGFGDLIPKSEWSMIALSVYLLFGLALTSMCINVIQEQLAVAFEEAKMRLGTRMGLEVAEGSALEDSLADSKSNGGGVSGPASGRSSKDWSAQEDSKKKRSKKSLEENNNLKSQSTTATPNTRQAELPSSFEIKKDQIGKSWKERREKKAASPLNHETSASLNPLPDLKPKMDLVKSPLSVSNLTLPDSSNPSLDIPNKVPRRNRPSNSPRRNVNFDQK